MGNYGWERSLRSIRWVLLLIVLVLLVGLGVLSFQERVGPTPPNLLPGGWALLSGFIDEEGGSWRATNAVSLQRDGVTLDLPAGTELRLRGDDLPEIQKGVVNVTVDRDFRFGDETFEPDGAVRAELTPEGLRLLDGLLKAQGQLLAPGSLRVRIRGINPDLRDRPVADPEEERFDDDQATGQVIDARDGQPIAGALIRVTFSHHDEGYPPIPEAGSQTAVRTNERGWFRVPVFRPEDPRLRMHLEVDHSAYLPEVLVLVAPPDTSGRWTFPTIELRRSLTTSVLFLDPDGAPLSGAPVVVRETHHDRFLGEDEFDEGRTQRRGRREIRYTEADGTLRVSKDRVLLSLLDPILYMWDPDVGAPQRYQVVFARRDEALGLEWEKWGIVRTGYGSALPAVLFDADLLPVSNALVEIEVYGMEAIRFYTDEAGSYRFAPRPYPRQLIPSRVRHPRPLPVRFDVPCSLEQDICDLEPREGVLTVLTPDLWKQEVRGTFDVQQRDRYLLARPAEVLAARLVFEDEGGELRPIPADHVRLDDAALTLVERRATGEVVWVGAIPEASQVRTVSVNGYEPRAFTIPSHLREDRFLDLGNLVCERGTSVEVRLFGIDPDDFDRVRLGVTPRKIPHLAQEYPVGASGTVVVSGLVPGEPYHFGVEGSRVEPFSTEIVVDQGHVEDGIQLDLVPRVEVYTRLLGSVSQLLPEETPGYRVVERYYVLDRADPISAVSYPLPPDGVFGSLRRLPATWRAEVFVVGQYFRVWRGSRVASEPGVYDLGVLEPQPSNHIIFRFCDSSAEQVRETLRLHADEQNFHEVARAFVVYYNALYSYLILDNLQEGKYQMRWELRDGTERTLDLAVSDREPQRSIYVPCLDPELQNIVVTLRSAEGGPVSGAFFESVRGLRSAEELENILADPELSWQIPEDLLESNDPYDGQPYLLQVVREGGVDFQVTAAGFLPQRWRVSEDGKFPAVIELQRGVQVEGVVRDAAGQLFDGVLEVTWEGFKEESRSGTDPEYVSVTNADPPATVEVIRGVLQAHRFPTGPQVFTFRDVRSEARARGVFQFEGSQQRELDLTLREFRSVKGMVYLPGGEPAVGAVVSLMRPRHAFRFPQREQRPKDRVYSARVDAVGGFEIDGLPLDLGDDWALVAQLYGWNDAVETPFDPFLPIHPLVLDYETELVLDIGFVNDHAQSPYRFFAEHSFAVDGVGPFRSLGRWLPQSEPRAFQGITPGTYRVTFAHTGLPESLADAYPQSSREVFVVPGRSNSLTLRITDTWKSGTARINGRPVMSGWVLLTDDPNDPESLRVARVARGEFRIPIPRSSGSLMATLIPDDYVDPAPNAYRGEALFVELPGGSRDHLDINYQAHDLTLSFPAGTLEEHTDLSVEYPHYEWNGQRYETSVVTERVRSNPMRLRLLQPGTIVFKTSRTGAFRVRHEVELDQDVTVDLTP